MQTWSIGELLLSSTHSSRTPLPVPSSSAAARTVTVSKAPYSSVTCSAAPATRGPLVGTTSRRPTFCS